MKTKKNFPNGFDEWIKTHFEMVRHLTINNRGAEDLKAQAVMAFQMTDALEQEKADGDTYYTIKSWTKKHTKLFIQPKNIK